LAVSLAVNYRVPDSSQVQSQVANLSAFFFARLSVQEDDLLEG
jgi:hypothetical protein